MSKNQINIHRHYNKLQVKAQCFTTIDGSNNDSNYLKLKRCILYPANYAKLANGKLNIE